MNGAIYAVGAENPTGSAITPFNYSINPNTFVISVLGGIYSDIANVIYEKKSLANMQGNTAFSVYEPVNGQTYTIQFLRPTNVPLQIQVNISDSPILPSDINTQISSVCSIVFNNQFEKIFTKYFSSKFQSQLALLQGINQLSVKLSIDGGITWLDTVQYDIDQYASLGTISINIAS